VSECEGVEFLVSEFLVSVRQSVSLPACVPVCVSVCLVFVRPRWLAGWLVG